MYKKGAGWAIFITLIHVLLTFFIFLLCRVIIHESFFFFFIFSPFFKRGHHFPSFQFCLSFHRLHRCPTIGDLHTHTHSLTQTFLFKYINYTFWPFVLFFSSSGNTLFSHFSFWLYFKLFFLFCYQHFLFHYFFALCIHKQTPFY